MSASFPWVRIRLINKPEGSSHSATLVGKWEPLTWKFFQTQSWVWKCKHYDICVCTAAKISMLVPLVHNPWCNLHQYFWLRIAKVIRKYKLYDMLGTLCYLINNMNEPGQSTLSVDKTATILPVLGTFPGILICLCLGFQYWTIIQMCYKRYKYVPNFKMISNLEA